MQNIFKMELYLLWYIWNYKLCTNFLIIESKLIIGAKIKLVACLKQPEQEVKSKSSNTNLVDMKGEQTKLFSTHQWEISIKIMMYTSLSYWRRYVQMNRINFLGFPYLDDWARIKVFTEATDSIEF